MTIPTFWTWNAHKLEEASAILWVKLHWYSADDIKKIYIAHWREIPEIQSMDIIEIAKKKAKSIFEVLHRPVIVEDTWLFFDSLKGFPWPFVKYIVDEKWPWIGLLFKMMDWVKDRTARAITWVCSFDWNKYTIWHWELVWIIPEKPRGNQFWWSNAFEPDWTWKTFWEMTENEKNQISMRKIALLDFMFNLKAKQG